jgi:hypothetical protein
VIEPEEMPTPAMVSAISAHEFFMSLRAAGFNRFEALQIVIAVIVAGQKGAPDDD